MAKAKVVLVTGASSGFGNMISRDLAQEGHIVYASMRGTKGHNAKSVESNVEFAQESNVDLRSVELDVQDEKSIAAAVDKIIEDEGRIDVLVQNAGHMVYGPTEAFTPEQLAQLYDVNVLGTQRVNRAVLPHMRKAHDWLLVWISSSSVAGGVPPLLGPYFAAKAGMDALAETVPDSADPTAVGRAVVEVVAAPYGKRPLRVHVDPASDSASVTFGVMDRVRSEFLHRIGYPELLHPNGV